MRAVGEPGAWSEAEQRAFVSAPTLAEGLAAVTAVRAAAEAKGETPEAARAWHRREHTADDPVEDVLALVGLAAFLLCSLGAGYGVLLGLRALWRLVP